MKSNIFGYLFFIFIIVIMGFAIYKVNYSDTDSDDTSTDGETTSTASTEMGTDLTVGISEFDTINPIITTNKKVQDITKLIYESLVEITEDGNVEPLLAKEWETSDNLTYIIKLNSGITWSDGTEFSSDDVKYTIDRLKETSDSVYSDNVEYVKEVDIVDDTTLRIILSTEVPFFEYYLNFPILSSSYYGDDDFWDTDKNEAPITTGRFEITDVTNSTITLTKNENWWNIEENDSIIETITINIYSTVAELYNAFKLGSIDFLATTNSNYSEYIGTIGYDIDEIEGRNFVFLALNTQSSLLSDTEVRKAIRYAINKDDIVSNIYSNTYMRANFPLNTTSYLVEDSNDSYYDTSAVTTTLEDAGWSLKNSQWQKVIDYTTTKLELNLVVKSGTDRESVAESIKSSLAEQGITINIIQASSSDYENYLESKDYDLILCESTISIAPDLTTYFGDNNLANYSNSEVSEIMGYIDNLTDEEELKTAFQKLYNYYNDDVPYIGIARNKIYVITNSYLTGEISSRWYNLFFNFKDWYTN